MKRTSHKASPAEPADLSLPDIGKILQRLRAQRNVTVRELAEQSDLSESFIRAVERGESDISLGRLARLARFFEYDLGAFLGFTTQLSARTSFAKKIARHSTVAKAYATKRCTCRESTWDLVTVEFAARTKLKDELTHEGIDVVYVTQGDVIAVVDGVDYPMTKGDCCVFSAAYRIASGTIRASPHRYYRSLRDECTKRVMRFCSTIVALIFTAGALLTGCARQNTRTAPSGNQLTVALAQEPVSLDPLLLEGPTAYAVGDLFYSYLTNYDSDGNQIPDLALQVPTLANGGVSSDGMHIVFHLRRGIRWQDGAPLTAADVVFTYRAIMNPDNAIPSRFGYDAVASVGAPDAYTVRLVLKRPLSPIVPF